MCGVREGEDCCALALGDEGATRSTLTILAPFDRPVPIAPRRTPQVVRPRRWLHALDRALLHTHPIDGLASIAHAPIRLLPYQLAPALSVLAEGTTRVLIADAVGLGKTIQAGIILHELSTASDAFRALVLAPAGLREQWADELASHFNVPCVIADASWLRQRASDLPPEVNPWSLPGTYVASHDFVKRPEALRPLENVIWDLVVVDEVHAVTMGTDRRAAIHAIACRSLRVVLLTATPYSGDGSAFVSLCAIGRVRQDEPPPLCFARSKTDVGEGRPRRSVVLAVAPSAAEREMHRLLESYSCRVWSDATRRGDDRARLASIVLRKRSLSSASSLASSVERRLELIAAAPRPEAQQLLLPLDDEDPLEDEEPAAILGAPGLTDAGREKRWLSAILETARVAARSETKLLAVLRLLRRVREPVIIFTEYRDTLMRLERHVAATGRAIAVLHGGMTPSERARIPALIGHGADVLLATDAAAEGLNLHHRCRIVVHYELPWNAARMEQRAGRVDRLGQKKRPHEIALVASATCERLVLAPLVARARGSPTGYRMLEQLGEARVADAIMGGAVGALSPAHAIDPRDQHTTGGEASKDDEGLRERAVREAGRLEWHRGLANRSGPAGDAGAERGPLITCIRRKMKGTWAGSHSRLVLTFLIAVESDEGRRMHAEPWTLALELIPAPLRTAADVRRTLEAARRTADEQIAALLRQQTMAVETRVAPVFRRVGLSLSERRDAIAHAAGSAARRIVQPRLFGRRTDAGHAAPRDVLEVPTQGAPAGMHTEARLVAAIVTPGWRRR